MSFLSGVSPFTDHPFFYISAAACGEEENRTTKSELGPKPDPKEKK